MVQRRILIVGGGIAGLTLFRLLQMQGHQTTLIEKNDSFLADGAGITLSINAMRALAYTGLTDSIVVAGHRFNTMQICDRHGTPISTLHTDRLSNPDRTPMIAIHRQSLHEILVNASSDGQRQLGTTVSMLQQSSHCVDVIFESGTREKYDFVIGADGIASQIRRLVCGDIPLRYSGYTCWRFVTKTQNPPHRLVEMWGRGQRLGVVPLGLDKTYIFATQNAPPRSRDYDNFSISDFKSLFRGFSGPATPILDSLKNDTVLLHNDLCDLPTICLGENRVILIGDAAHASTPNLGQGAAMGIEDAVALAFILSEEKNSDQVLARYRVIREQRVKLVRDRSYTLGKLAQIENAFARWCRDLVLKLTPERIAAKNLEQLFFKYKPCPIRNAY